MKFSNVHNLPQAFVRAVMNDPYDKGHSEFSATGLMAPPRQRVLQAKHDDEIVIDVSTRVDAMFGKGTHMLLELGARPDIDIVEKRYFTTIDGVVISAQIDLLQTDTRALYDWKTTKAWAFNKGFPIKPEYIFQMNVQRELILSQPMNDWDIDELFIVGMLKDWSEEKAKDDVRYPKTQIVTLEIPIWPREKTVEKIRERIRLHKLAEQELPLCSKEETWQWRRCEKWCDPKHFCSQYQGYLNNKRSTKL